MRNTLLLLTILLGLTGASFGQTGLPQTVATIQRFNQTGPLPMDTLWAPAFPGIYRVTIVMVVTVGNGQPNSDWLPTLEWEDERGEETYQFPVSPQNANSSSVSVSIRDLPSGPIKGGVASSGDTSGSKYDVFVVVEEIM
jgi:hypothetical protein